jgi:hypothetical protein
LRNRRIAKPSFRWRSVIARLPLLAFLHPAAQGIPVDAVTAAKADQRGGDAWLVWFPHG